GVGARQSRLLVPQTVVVFQASADGKEREGAQWKGRGVAEDQVRDLPFGFLEVEGVGGQRGDGSGIPVMEKRISTLGFERVQVLVVDDTPGHFFVFHAEYSQELLEAMDWVLGRSHGLVRVKTKNGLARVGGVIKRKARSERPGGGRLGVIGQGQKSGVPIEPENFHGSGGGGPTHAHALSFLGQEGKGAKEKSEDGQKPTVVHAVYLNRLRGPKSTKPTDGGPSARAIGLWGESAPCYNRVHAKKKS